MKKSRIAKLALMGASITALAATLTTSTYAWYVSTTKADITNGTGATGSWGISITGNAATADKWKTARAFKIGNTPKNVDGSADVTWTLNEIGVYSKATSDNRYVNVDPNAQNISYKKVVSGIECDYYVRIFSRLPNFKFASGDTTNYYNIYKHLIA